MRLHHALVHALLLTSGLTAFAAEPAAPADSPISCNTGPALKTFGGTHWLAYACSDGKSLALVSAKDNPACPAYFIISPKGGRYTVNGSGTGRHDTIPAVEKELRALPAAEVAAVLSEAVDAQNLAAGLSR